MKKTVAVLILLTTVAVFFCATTVNAAGIAYSTEVHRTYTLATNVTLDMYARALYPSDDTFLGDSQYNDYGHMTWNCIVTVVIKNKTSKNQYVKNINPVLYMDVPSGAPSIGTAYNSIVGIENMTNDLYFTIGNENYLLWTVADTDWTFLDGFVVPANSSMSAVAVCKFPCYFQETNGGHWYNATLTDIQVTANRSTEDTDYTPQGSHEDLLISIEALRSYLTGNNGIPLIDSDLDSIQSTLNDIKAILQANTSTNTNISNNSSSLKNTSDNIHTQEQAFFDANNTAMANIGLSNYRFNNGTVVGLSRVTDDFNALWNSLGSFSSVYVFSLTLTIALTIIRHAPNAISRARRRDYVEAGSARNDPKRWGG